MQAINDMATRSLRCVAIAYRPYDFERTPADSESLDSWILPEDDLILLAIVGIKVCRESRVSILEIYPSLYLISELICRSLAIASCN